MQVSPCILCFFPLLKCDLTRVASWIFQLSLFSEFSYLHFCRYGLQYLHNAGAVLAVEINRLSPAARHSKSGYETGSHSVTDASDDAIARRKNALDFDIHVVRCNWICHFVSRRISHLFDNDGANNN